MTEQSSSNVYEKIVEINNKLNHAEDFDSALTITIEELQKALDANQIQIILHRSEQTP